MAKEIYKPLDPILRRCAAYKALSEMLQGDQLMQAMWMIEERDQSAFRLSFLSFVGVTAEIFGAKNHEVSHIYIKTNQYLNQSIDKLLPDPLPEMQQFRDIIQKEQQSADQSRTAKQLADKSVSMFRDHDLRQSPRGEQPQLTPENIKHIGQALALEAKKYDIGTIVMAYDDHDTSITLSHSLAEGIQSIGLNVLNLGKSPIPVLYFVTQHFEGKTGVMISSENQVHQQMELKVIIAGEILVKEKTQRLLRSIDDTELLKNNWGKLEENNSFVEEYIGMICEDIRLTRPMKIILDGNTGASGLLMTNLLQEIGCEVLHPPSKLNETPLDDNSDSTINNNLDNLSASVRMHQADFGVTFHQDGAVLNLVDSQGKIISPEQLIMLFSQAVLASYPGSEIILDDQCPEQLIKYIGANRGRSITCKAEPLLIKAELKVTAAKFAGDLHGRFYFNDRWFGFEDALYATCRLVEILSSDTRSSSEVFASIV